MWPLLKDRRFVNSCTSCSQVDDALWVSGKVLAIFDEWLFDILRHSCSISLALAVTESLIKRWMTAKEAGGAINEHEI